MGNINSSLQNAWQGFFYSLAGNGVLTKKQANVAAGLIDKSVGVGGVLALTGATTLTADDSGKTIHLDSATAFAVTLPAAAAGINFQFVVTTAPSGGNHTVVTPASANVINGITVEPTAGVTATAAADTITFVDSVAAVGDRVLMYCDGTNWSAQAFVIANGGITITQESA